MSDERDASGAPERGDSLHDRVHVFRTDEITVTWSKRRCIHAAVCVFALPRVFAPGRRPWVDPTAAPADDVAAVVLRCPTGALHYERAGGEAETPPPTSSLRVTRNGPTHVHGDVELLDEAGTVLLRDTRVALCRCGGSANKPLCDGAHHALGFRHDGSVPQGEALAQPADSGSATLRVIVRRDGPLVLEGPFELRSDDGRTVFTGTASSLCRCGRSQAKPFCDGSHARPTVEHEPRP